MRFINLLFISTLKHNNSNFGNVLRANNSKDGENIEKQSFFHPIPKNSSPQQGEEEDKKESSSDTFDLTLKNEIDRRQNLNASKPSTIGGVPTSKAHGFGKDSNNSKLNKKKDFVEIGQQGPSVVKQPKMNDPTNPEVDDQGFTLYANPQTGERKRVLDALVEYPCDFKMKIIGENGGSFVADILNIVSNKCNTEVSSIKYTENVVKSGKWVSVTVHAPVESAQMVYELYEIIDQDPRVKFKF